jgi:predicted RNase H-like nuclease (RuvC/YqgF family)
VILIEHPIRQGWKLAETQKPVEATPTLYRFQGNAIAGKVTVLTVKEESIRQETITMLPADIGQLVTYSRTGEIPQAVRDAIAKAIQLKQGVLDAEAQVSNRTEQIGAITQEQERIRENMKTVDAKSQYYLRLLAKLNEQESSIEKLQKERDDLLAKRDVQQKALEDYLNGLTVG